MHRLGYAVALMAIVATMGLTKAQDPTIEPKHVVLKKYGKASTLQCVVEDLESFQPMQWYFNGEQLTDDGDKYSMQDLNGTLNISNVMPEDVGAYMCQLVLGNGQTFNQTVNLEYRAVRNRVRSEKYDDTMPYVHKFDKSKNLVQGDPLVLECIAVSNPEPVLTWLKNNEPLDMSDERLALTENSEGMANGTLRLDDLQFEDRADYTCVATNAHGSDNSTILVRVKDKLAALWPFLGICAEVAVLVIIIFVYENRRSKKLEELDAREEADHLTNSHAHKGGDEVRQRK